MEVVLLVLMLLPGLTVLAFSANLLLSLVPCSGRWVLMTWAILAFLFLKLLILFEQWAGHKLLSEKVTKPHVRANRPVSFPSVPVSEGIEIRHGCQFISSLVGALAKLAGGLGRFLPCGIGSHMSRLRHLGWNQCSRGLTSRPLESCHHQCLKAICGVLGYRKGAASELLDGTLKLQYCSALSTARFPRGRYPGLEMGKVYRQSDTPVHLLEESSDTGRKVRLTRKTRPGASSHVIPDPGHPTPRRWKILRPPFLQKEREVRWAGLATFFLAVGLGEVCTGDAWDLTCLRREQAWGFFRLVSPFLFDASVRAYGQTRAYYTPSAPLAPGTTVQGVATPVCNPVSVVCSTGAMFGARDGDGEGAARRRRERRLRSWLRQRAAERRDGPARVQAPLLKRTEKGQGRGGGARGKARRATATEAPSSPAGALQLA